MEQERKILIVDDDAFVRTSYRRFLESDNEYSYTFSEVDTCSGAIKKCLHAEYDCILLDYQLPDMNGFNFIECMKKQSKLDNMVIVMITGVGNEDLAVNAMKNGVQDYIVKEDLSQVKLKQSIDSAIKEAALLKTIRQQNREIVNLKEKYALFLEKMSDAVVFSEVDSGTINYVNRAAERVFGRKKEELIGRQLSDVTKEAGRTARRRKNKPDGKLDENWMFDETESTRMPVEWRGSVVEVDGQEFFMAIIRDLSDRLKVEEEIKKGILLKEALQSLLDLHKVLRNVLEISLRDLTLEEMLEEIIELILQSVFTVKEFKGSIFLVEDEPNELVLKTFRNFPEDLHQKCSVIKFGECLCGRAAKRGKVVFASHVDKFHTHSTEQMEPHGHYCVPILSKGKVLGLINVYVSEGHTRDLGEEDFLIAIANTMAGIIERKKAESEQEQMQNQLVQSSKLASIGTLATGVAHEINNPLSIIQGYADMIETDEDDPEEMRLHAQVITEAAGRIKKIIDHLTVFARESEKEKMVSFELESWISNSLMLLKSQLELKGIAVNLAIDEGLPEVMGNPNQLEMVVQNLIGNCIDSFDNIMEQGSKNITISINKKKKNWVLAVKDTGEGIPKDILPRVLEPFYSTKDIGKGTGLGLSMAYEIVQKHQGKMTIESEVGKGTKVLLTFPLQV